MSQPAKTSRPSSVDFFMDLSQQPSAAISNEKSLELSVPKNVGWSTFDMPHQSTSTAQVEIRTAVTATADSLQESYDPFLNLNANMLWLSSETSSISVLSSVSSNLWHDGKSNGEEQVSVMATNTGTEQPWSAFKDSATSVLVGAFNQGLQMSDLSSTDDQILDLRASKGSNKGGMQGIAPLTRFDHDFSSHFVSGSSCPLSAYPPMDFDLNWEWFSLMKSTINQLIRLIIRMIQLKNIIKWVNCNSLMSALYKLLCQTPSYHPPS